MARKTIEKVMPTTNGHRDGKANTDQKASKVERVASMGIGTRNRQVGIFSNMTEAQLDKKCPGKRSRDAMEIDARVGVAMQRQAIASDKEIGTRRR